ncbi:hypothetical protein SAMN05192573_113116 [Mucilaginibacter gossypii]|uniref:Uncharacterized protein n=1 Tax=Mucilaginibacter gossypii TaxID=551996 RepID=A0A1G8FZK8_9SPHI|nr:hypothetical protein SAMN05192573_113116 [Mucilaginibacter gossypii]
MIIKFKYNINTGKNKDGFRNFKREDRILLIKLRAYEFHLTQALKSCLFVGF